MINIIIWFASFLCPNPNHTPANHGDCKKIHVTCNPTNGFDTGGETGGNPPPPPPPPPPFGG